MGKKMNKKKIFKYFIALITGILLLSCANNFVKAENSLRLPLNKIIESSNISRTAIVSVSFRDAKTGNLVYEKEGNILLHPASTLKSFTTPVILKYLGNNSDIKTSLYKFKDNIYIKLSGDPLLTEQDLSNLIKTAKFNEFFGINGSIVIDDTAIDDIPWGTGWMWDDGSNSLMPKYNSYNLDHNLFKVKVIPTQEYDKPKVSINPYYPLKIINNALTSNNNNLIVEKHSWQNPDAIYITGSVSSLQERDVPVENPEKYFTCRLKQILKTNNINYKNIIKGKIPVQAVLIGEIKHNLLNEISKINKNSDNLAAETLFKIAGGKYSGKIGTTEQGLKAFNEFYSKLGADPSELFIVDASGVSHNDLIQTNWMTLALSKLYNMPDNNTYLQTLARPREAGTLSNRLTDMSGVIWAKTGTHAGISGICGYLRANSGRVYSFAILVQNFKGSSLPSKKLEDDILKSLFIGS